MSDKIDTLGDALPREIARVQELLAFYVNLGPAGQFGAAKIRDTLTDDRSIEDLGNDEETLDAAINRIRELEAVLESTANFLRGMSLDRRIAPDIFDAICYRVVRLDQVEAAKGGE